MIEYGSTGFLILDRKGEYIEDTLDQRGNKVYGLHHHPNASERMVIVSKRSDFAKLKGEGRIHDYVDPLFNIADIDPVDLADFLPDLTDVQANLVRDYSYIPGFYEKLLAETQFGAPDTRHWYQAFPGLFDLNRNGKSLLKKYEQAAVEEGRTVLTDEERDTLHDHITGQKAEVLERAAGRIKRFCLHPLFGGSTRGRDILAVSSTVQRVIEHLRCGRFVFLDMRGRPDEEYTLVAAMFARKLLTLNKNLPDAEQVRVCVVLEEAHNILSDAEVKKGNGRGSVFVELAREGRSFKLGFILVTQQPDARSISPEVAKTIDTVVAFNMHHDDARHLERLNSAFDDLVLEIHNASELAGVAVSTGGPVLFRSVPVDPAFMQACVSDALDDLFFERTTHGGGGEELPGEARADEVGEPPPLEDRLALLMRQRQDSIQEVALETMRAWKAHPNGAVTGDAAGDVSPN